MGVSIPVFVLFCTTCSLILGNGLSMFVSSSSANKVPRFEGLKINEGFHAIVRENDRTVIISPRIKIVDGGEICDIEVLNKHHGEIPFEVKITDRLSGEAILEARRELNCEKRRAYKFNIRAVSCNGAHSDNATVYLTVEDVNEYSPIFRQESYTVTIPEGRLIDPIVQVEATDHDCSSRYSEICKYEIIGGDKVASPFDIDSNGNIKNTRPLSWKESHNYILEVVAYDCGMKRSKSALVNIKVNKVCQLGWKEIHERIEYIPTSGQKILFPEAELQLCDVPCDVQDVSVQLALSTSHIGKGCDRDTYSIESQRKLCGSNVASVDLLPSPGIGADWTRYLPTDEGHESDQIFEFDGASVAAMVPDSVLDHNLTNQFSISFWMKHEPPADHTNKHIKEHIICNADDHKKNRHHYALFVRNCRLILLLRREFNQEKRTIFRPAEWRWKLSEACDNKWHHYSVSVNFPEVSLYLDGQLYKNTTTNPEIVDDWPLHAMKGVNTSLSVGACWEGKANRLNFHFRGFLAGLSILRGANESPDVLNCLHRCKEGLEMPPSDSLDSGTDVSINTQGTEITIVGKDAIDVEDMISQISYINTREYPTPGRRSLHLTTSIRCSNGKTLKVPSVDSYIMVLPPEQPSISLNGTPNLAREYEAFVQGIELFSTVSILVNHEVEIEDEEDNNVNPDDIGDLSSEDSSSNNKPTKDVGKLSNVHKLDTCSIQVYPPLNPDHEYFRLPTNFMTHLGVRFTETKDGIVINGADTVHNYQTILREIVYFNHKPAYYLNRAFKLTCSELNGRFISNDYFQTLTVIHPKVDPSNLTGSTSNQQGTISSSSSSSSSSPANNNDNNGQGNIHNNNNVNSGGGGSSMRHNGNSASNNNHNNEKTNNLNIMVNDGQQQQQQQQQQQHGRDDRIGIIASHAQVHQQQVELKDSKIKSNGFRDSLESSESFTRTSASHAVTVIIVVCVGFLVFMIVLGVIRIRAAHHRSSESRDEEQEMAWDDTSLTITVNPLDQIEQEQENLPIQEDDDDSDSSDDGSSYRDDGESSEDEVEKTKTRRELEWDDSTLTF